MGEGMAGGCGWAWVGVGGCGVRAQVFGAAQRRHGHCSEGWLWMAWDQRTTRDCGGRWR